jgi:hypothetical protein
VPGKFAILFGLLGSLLSDGTRVAADLPRRHKWDYHLRWDGPVLVGRTAIGRVTVQVLAINDPVRVGLRREFIEEGLFPPE